MSAPIRLLLAALVLAVASPAWAQALNEIHGFDVTELEAATEIRISGDHHPTYSVYRLRNPQRLFVDVSNAALSGDALTEDVHNGVINQVGIVAYEDELSQVARLVIGFDQDALYDVDTDGNDVVIRVDGESRNLFVGRDVATDADRDALVAELGASSDRVQALELALRDAEQRAEAAETELLSSELERERAEQARLAAIAEQNDLVADVSSISAQRDETLAQLSMLEDELVERDETLAAQAERLEALEVERAETLQRIERLQSTVDTQAAALDTTSSELASLEGELAVEVANGAESDSADALRAQIAARTAEIESLRTEMALTESQLGAALNDARDARNAEDALRAEQAAAPVVADNTIRDIRYEHTEAADRIVIDLPGTADFTTLEGDATRAALALPDAILPDNLRRTLDTQAFGGPVDFISSYEADDGTTRVVVELNETAAEVIHRDGDSIIWEFARVNGADPAAVTASAPQSSPYYAPVTAQSSHADPFAMANGERITSATAARPRMTQKRITIDLREADIANVLRLIADEGNVNIIASSDVNGSITLRLRSVPLDEAMVVILRSRGLGWEQTGSIIRVAPAEVFQQEYDDRLRLLANAAELEPVLVRIIPVNYADAGRISGLVSGVLSSRGQITVDDRNNALIVTDIGSQLEMAEQMVERVDTQTPQILIEARIVETNDQFRRQLGIQWGGDYVADQANGNATGLRFPSTIGIAGGAADSQSPTAGTSSTPNYAVNLPAPAGTGTGGAIGFTFGSLSGAFNLNLRLSAAEETGSIKVISAPRIMTINNERASITSGVSIPVSVVSAAGAQTVFFDASIALNVTPRVTADGSIFLDLDIQKNEPDFENTGARGDPSIIRREARTQLLSGDGDTTVIGGIFQRNTGFSQSRVPFFAAIPVLGPLFRNSSQTDVRNELLIFITPRIVNREQSIDRIGSGGDFVAPAGSMMGGGDVGGGGGGGNNERDRERRRRERERNRR